MKLKAAAVVLAAIVLSASVWSFVCHNQKSTDNLPSLSAMAEMEEADANELLAGYSRTQLRNVWQEPAFVGSNQDIWEIDEKTALIVSYNNFDKVVVCGFSI
jgi:hypothetical protein